MNKARIEKKTDHFFFQAKLKLRLENLPPQKSLAVLDCFAGNGQIWREIKRLRPDLQIEVLSIDTKTQTEGIHLIGNNLKFLRSLNLSDFDVIDLDAYGIPFRQLQYILERRRSHDVTIYLTFIQNIFGALPHRLLLALGYPKTMVVKIPTLFYRHGFEKLKEYLAIRGIRSIRYYCDYRHRKHYLWFIMKPALKNGQP